MRRAQAEGESERNALELFFAEDDVLTRGGGGARPIGEEVPPTARLLAPVVRSGRAREAAPRKQRQQHEEVEEEGAGLRCGAAERC